MTTVELEPSSLAAGGDAVARDADGRVVFVGGALPGERVRATVTDERRTFARAELVSVLDPSPHRRRPPCRHVVEGCGGCDWQHIEPAAQSAYRRTIVVDALERLGGIVAPKVVLGPELASEGYRTTIRATVVNGRAGFRRRSSHDGLAVDDCLIAHPLLQELIADGRYGDATEVTLRAGARTGERLVVVDPTVAGVRVPDGVLVVGRDELDGGRSAWFHEMVAGRTWRVSASSFFQARPDGAEVLVDVAAGLIADRAPDAAALVDLCAGVGLFAGALGEGRDVVAVERHAPAVADARHNLADRAVRFVRSSFERWTPSPADVVVADPARSGLGREGVAAVAGSGAGLVVLVSCDPASLGRDAGLLTAAGYTLVRGTIVDLFPNTSHVEAICGFVR